MNVTVENILLIGSLLLFIGVLASKTSGKLGVPSLILFLIVGILAGSEGIGGIQFDEPQMAQSLGIIALAFILFAGGIETKWISIRNILWRGAALSTMGVLFTSLAAGIFISWMLGVSLIYGMLIGAIVSSTDAAAVFSILRSKNVGLKKNLRPLLELESGSNDPMAFFLTIGLTTILINPEMQALHLLPMFFQQMIIGAMAGVVMGYLMIWIINHIDLDVEGLYPVLTISLVLITYSLTDFIYGNGFLAVYISALILGNHSFIHKKSLMKFYDGVAWLMQVMMFITLGLLVFPSQIVPVIGTGLIIALFLIFVARPVGIFLSLAPFKMGVREKLFLSWVGLRGAVPIVFATYPMLAGIEGSEMIFNLVFFIVLTSVLLQGTTLPLVARWLMLDKPEPMKPRYPLEVELSDDVRNTIFEVQIPPDSEAIGKSIVQLNLPSTALIVLINRDNKYVTPNGSTEIHEGDKLTVMAESDHDLERVKRKLDIYEANIKA